ncbi:MAG: hypothetical protein P1P88_21495 [Bacteroidales bacterium]|nr:hypothetical protein [Bacteroidales bacterium]
MVEKKRIKVEWLIIAILAIVIIVGGFFVFKDKGKTEKVNAQVIDTASLHMNPEQMVLMKKYEMLETAYNTTINEIETVIGDDNVNLSILKENLTQILADIKVEKEKITLGTDSSEKAEDNTQQLEQLLNMSKEVLAERLLEEKNRNEKLTIDNRKLHFNLKKSIDHFEKEKTKNVELNAEVAQIKTQIKNIEQEGSSSQNELKLLQRQKNEIERKLKESDKMIKEQTEQIQDLGDIIRKVNLDCFYYYEKDNPTEEAKIYLTSQGVSEKYVRYFVRSKPDIWVEFKITKDVFDSNLEKVELKLYNSLNIEIYSVSKAVSAENVKIIIPNKNFAPGKYSISLKAGDDDLLLDERYWFKISN